jgi:hypothetical protein
MNRRRFTEAQIIAILREHAAGLSLAEHLLHESQRYTLIAHDRDADLGELAFAIDRRPEVEHLSVQLFVRLTQVPWPVSEPAHRSQTRLADASSEHWAEPVPPIANAPFVRAMVVEGRGATFFDSFNRNRRLNGLFA